MHMADIVMVPSVPTSAQAFLPIKSEFLVVPLPIMFNGTTLNIPLPDVIVGQLSRGRV